MNTDITSKSELSAFISSTEAVLLYFYNDSCAPCVALRPKVGEMVDEHFPKMKLLFINAAHNPEITGEYQVFASPTILVFFESKETLRLSKYVSIAELAEKIDRYYTLIFE